jgi:type IV pilus assembly protein PilC
MAKFKFTAVSSDGTTISGVEDALTASMARRALADRKLASVEVTEKKRILKFEITKKKVARRELMHFSRQMAVFMRAGIPVLEALEVMTDELGNKALSRVLAEMADSLRSGETFAGAATLHPEAFPPYYLGILRSAELTGNLDIVLDQLADYIDRDIEARRKVSGALMYPGIVLSFAILAVVIITGWVLPRFKTFFSSLHAKLPLPTRMLLAIANFFTNDWYVIAAVVAIIIMTVILGSVTKRGRAIRDQIFLKMPVLGDLIRTAILERFCRILYSMVSTGVPLPEALQVTSEATTNTVYRSGLSDARSKMMRGEGLAGPLSATGLFPSAARHMLLVGESTGTMDDQLESAAIYFDRELDYKLKRFTALFEPAIITFVGIVVGFVAIALISAMYGIYRQVHI